MVIRIGTRGSDLALWQARHVRELLRARARADAELVVLETQGDRDQVRTLAALGAQGVFTKELERALQDGRIDVAVHSHKDLPTTIADDLEVAAVPERGPVREALVVRADALREGAPHLPLAAGARVGTGSARRRAQLLALRPDLAIEDLRGNVPTRLAKLADGRVYDAILLAEAGLVRLGLDPAPHRAILLDPRAFVPAPAQGALALQTRRDAGPALRSALALLHHEPTARAVAAERGVLAGLAGGCNLPLGCHAVLEGGVVRLLAVLGRDDGALARVEVTAPDPVSASREVFARLRP